ncbi:MAG: WbqC family protein [candidate division KSB1 bacterium]|nr:WbqC family protein [candidate division KSB1 bacterium]MDZ7365243.1 WbqC family protein [candidate division KSB1 bacterium]MDZ7403110.1 WbqC family protein [candidate division KSB1 bacterium]
MRTLTAEVLSFLPGENFFVLAAGAEVFVAADDVQFSTNSHLNRTRIKTANGAAWLTIPVLSRGRGLQKLNEVEIDPTRSWQRQHWRTIEFNYHNAPYFGELADGLEELYQRPYQKLAEAAWEFLQFIWKALRWENLPQRTSALGITSSGEQRLADLAKTLQAEVYVTHEKYRAAIRPERMSGVRLQFVNWNLPPYHQQFGDFIGGLNMLDLLFNEGIAFTRERLQRLAGAVRTQVNR